MRRERSNEQVNLDVVRAVAVLCVFFAHLYERVIGHEADISWHFGQMGVLIFFVHTACVLMWSLERTYATMQTPSRLVADFYVRRAFRIYPLAILCVTVAVWIRAHTTVAEYLANATLTLNLFDQDAMWWGLWTLPLEMQMYVTLPLLFLWSRTRSAWWLVAAWAIMIPVGLLQPIVSSRLNLFAYVPCFLAGILAWRLSRTHQPTVAAGWWPLVFVATWSIWLIAPKDHREMFRWTFCLALGAAIPWFRDLSHRWLIRPAHLVAKYSYGIYLSHLPIQTYALRLHGWPMRMAVLWTLAVAVPVLVFHGIEQPMIDVGRRLARHLNSRWALPEAPTMPPASHSSVQVS